VTAVNDAARAGWSLRYAPHLGVMTRDAPMFRCSARSIEPVDQIAFIASCGFAGILDNQFRARPDREQASIGEALARFGLEMGCFVNHGGQARQRWGFNDEAVADALAAGLTRSLEAAKRGGARRIVVVSDTDPLVPRSYQLAGFIENLKRLADLAAAADVTLCLEHVAARRFPELLLNHIADACMVVKAVDHPAVRLVFDVGHVQEADGDILMHLDACWDMIGAVQVADIPGRAALGSGEIHWPRILGELRARGYSGLVELEHDLDPTAAAEAAFLATLHQLDGSTPEP
jgi:hydroxypyruvate isomerase